MTDLTRRYVDWHINDRGTDYEVIRYENGKVIQVAICQSRKEAWAAYEYDRAVALADPLAIETKPMEQGIR